MTSADGRLPVARWRSARECVFGVCAAWLLVQNVVIGIALVCGGPSVAGHLLAPLLGIACLLMTPLWLLPAIALLAGGRARREHAHHGVHEVTR